MSEDADAPEMMLKQDFKESQRRENYRRAEAFLTWKFGPMRLEVDRFLRGSGMNWPSLFVEFCEKVEEDLLAQMRIYEEQAWKSIELRAALPFTMTMEDLAVGKSPSKEATDGPKPEPPL